MPTPNPKTGFGKGWPKPSAVDFTAWMSAVAGGLAADDGPAGVIALPKTDFQSEYQNAWYGSEVGYGAPATGSPPPAAALYAPRGDPEVKVISPGLPSAASSVKKASHEAEPRPRCPNCGRHVTGLAKADVLSAPSSVGWTSPSRILYQIESCGCRVSGEWAGAYAQEMKRRDEGKEPLPVVDMTPEARAKKVARIENELADTYSLLDAAVEIGDEAARTRYGYELVCLTDTLMRLVPGQWNKAVKPADLPGPVKTWAEKHGLQTPPLTEAGKTEEAAVFNKYANEHLFPKGLGKPQTLNTADGVKVFLPCGRTVTFAEDSTAQSFASDYMEAQSVVAQGMKAQAEPLSENAVLVLIEKYGYAVTALGKKKPGLSNQTLPKGPKPEYKPGPPPPSGPEADRLGQKIAAYAVRHLKVNGKPPDDLLDFALESDTFLDLSKDDCVALADLVCESLVKEKGRTGSFLRDMAQVNPFFHAVLHPRLALAAAGHKPNGFARKQVEIADAVLKAHEEVLDGVRAAYETLKTRTHYSFAVIQNAIRVGRPQGEQQECRAAIEANVKAYLDDEEPLTQDAAKYVALFLESTNPEYVAKVNGKTLPKPKPAQPVAAGPVLLPAALEAATRSVTPDEVKAARRLKFAASLARTKRVIRSSKKKAPDGEGD